MSNQKTFLSWKLKIVAVLTLLLVGVSGAWAQNMDVTMEINVDGNTDDLSGDGGTEAIALAKKFRLRALNASNTAVPPVTAISEGTNNTTGAGGNLKMKFTFTAAPTTSGAVVYDLMYLNGADASVAADWRKTGQRVIIRGEEGSNGTGNASRSH